MPLQTLEVSASEVLSSLNAYEKFCFGEDFVSPEEFRRLDRNLSIGAVMHIGQHSYSDQEDGKHLIWTAPDGRVHDLGSVEQLDTLDEYPGFHRVRSLSLGHDRVSSHKIIDVAYLGYATKVRLDRDTVGVGPNYKTALRNAALRLHLEAKQSSSGVLSRVLKCFKRS